MILEILSTGDEVLTGAVVDSNSAHMARELTDAGFEVRRHGCVGDDEGEMVRVLLEMAGRADALVVTGGLGPTEDDRTAAAAARAAGCSLKEHPRARRELEAYYAAKNFAVTPSGLKQTLLPEGADCLSNPVGTACGFCVPIKKVPAFFLPGVPFEMKTMLEKEVMPRLLPLRGEERLHLETRTLKLFGLGESSTGDILAGAADGLDGVRLGYRAVFPEVHVKLYARGENPDQVAILLDRAQERVATRLGDRIFSDDGRKLEAVVGDLLRQKGQTLALAESCTGGLLAHRITEVAGSSDYFLFSGVTYSNSAKTRVLGVSPQTLEAHGAVSTQTAAEMAKGARKVSGAHWGISTSGIAGPGGGTDEKPVGTVCIGVSGPSLDYSGRLVFSFNRRQANKAVFAQSALELLRRALLGLDMKIQ